MEIGDYAEDENQVLEVNDPEIPVTTEQDPDYCPEGNAFRAHGVVYRLFLSLDMKMKGILCVTKYNSEYLQERVKNSKKDIYICTPDIFPKIFISF